MKFLKQWMVGLELLLWIIFANLLEILLTSDCKRVNKGFLTKIEEEKNHLPGNEQASKTTIPSGTMSHCSQLNHDVSISLPLTCTSIFTGHSAARGGCLHPRSRKGDSVISEKSWDI